MSAQKRVVISATGKAVSHLAPHLLEEYLQNLGGDILVAWDAPLTGCADPDGIIKSDLSQRVVDCFLARLKPAKGVSVLPYSGVHTGRISDA